MDHVVRMLNVVNDVADCSIKLLQDFSGKITEDDAECQELMQSIEQQRKTKTLYLQTMFLVRIASISYFSRPTL